MKYLVDKLSKEERELYERILQAKDEAGFRYFWRRQFQAKFASLVWLLQYRDLTEFHHKEIKEIGKFRFIDDTPWRRLWLWSRVFFKTSLITIAHEIYLIINNPNIRTLLPSYTLDVAKKILLEMKGHFTNNDEFRYFFPDFCPKANKDGKIEFGTTEKFTTPARKRIFKEPTVMVVGVGTNLTGLHFDNMKPDDLVCKESVTNDAQIQQSKEYYAYLRPFFDNQKCVREDISGSIYHFNDLHVGMKDSGKFKVSYIPARLEDGTYPFPNQVDAGVIEEMENDPSIGPDVVSTQYLLNPRNPKDCVFKEDWFKYFKWEELPEGLAEYICVDPASTLKKRSDFTVLERWGVDGEGNHWLLEGVRDKLTAFQRINVLFRMVHNAKALRWVKYEVLGGRHGDLEVIKERQFKEKFGFDVKETKSTTASKRDRITQRLVGPYHAGIIKVPYALNFKSLYDGKVYNFSELLKLEFLQYPNPIHDDILDAQSQMFEEAVIKGRKTLKPQEEKPITADDEERHYQLQQQLRKVNPLMTHDGLMKKLRIRKFRKMMARI